MTSTPRSHLRTTPFAWLLLGALLLALLPGRAHAGAALRPWHELRSGNFRLLTEAPVEAARSTLEQLESLRSALLGPLGLPVETGPVDIFLFADRGSYARWAGAASVAKTSWRTARPLILLSARGPEEGPHRLVLAHELTHALSHAALGTQPRWVAEGLAEVLERLELHEQGGPTVRLPAPATSPRWTRETARTVLPLEDLWAWDAKLPPRSELPRYYGSAWAWTWYLRVHHPQELAAFHAALGRGERGPAAFQRAFSAIAPETLWERVRGWVGRGRSEDVKWSLPALMPAAYEEAPLSEAEARVVRAWVRLLGFDGRPLEDRRRLAAAELSRALELAPENESARTLQSQLGGAWNAEVTALSELR